MNNYRPISIIPVVAKVFERIVYDQVLAYSNNHNLISNCQSAFRGLHFTATALLEAKDNWAYNIDSGRVNAVVFLDLKKAFDTVDHDILLFKLLLPLIKKMSLDRDEFNHFRPISNLAFLSKTLEKIVDSQLDTYLTKHQLYAKMQSTYRIHHSTETALLRVVNDVMRGIDDQQECVLVLLDLSSAYDTIDHDILLARLCNRYGLSGVVLDWLKSYLCDRPQRVVVDNVSSRPCFDSCGIPQGSVLGPLLFSLYISPLEDVIMSHGIDAMMYADDSQLYIFLNRNNRVITTEKLEA